MTKEGVKHLNGVMNACKAEVPWPCVFYDDFIHLLIVLKPEDVVHVATDSTNWSFTTGKILVRGPPPKESPFCCAIGREGRRLVKG